MIRALVFLIISGLGLFFILDAAERETAAVKPSRCFGQTEKDAWYMAKRFVERNLKAPSTASFQNYFDADASQIAQSVNCTWTVRGYVDAENSFGAKIRSHYIVMLRPVGGSKWQASRVEIQ
jgi:hypothetical protein